MESGGVQLPEAKLELTERLLMEVGGWQVFKEAKVFVESGKVLEGMWDGKFLRGAVLVNGKKLVTGLEFRSRNDVLNLCGCRDAQVRGIICAHAVAVGLGLIRGKDSGGGGKEVSHPSLEQSSVGAREGRVGRGVGICNEQPRVRMRIEGSLRHLEAEVEFRYLQEGAVNREAEEGIYVELGNLGFEKFRGLLAMKGEERISHFLVFILPKLRERWEIEVGERLRSLMGRLVPVRRRIQIHEGVGGWLEVGVHYDAGGEAVLTGEDVRRLLASGRRQFVMKSGRVAVLDERGEEEWREVLKDCDPEQRAGRMRVRKIFEEYLREVVAETSGRGAGGKAVSGEAVKLGKMRQVLRPYQVEGAGWMLERARRVGGGLLADEMGLGKTVQALAFLEVYGGPSLVVCPSSLVWNWAYEAGRFLPEAKVTVLQGAGRDAAFSEIEASLLVITSYALLRRDIEKLVGFDFRAVILDEAQHIKNPSSQNAVAAGRLRGSARFVLTGTPVENSVRDLWSLFEFVAPGYLGTREDFRVRYEEPILAGGGEEAYRRLRRRVGPFVLRRLKREILRELPPKIEQVVMVELSERERAVYEEIRRGAREQLDILRKSAGQAAARMRAWTALLRLRQVCCDLRLVGVEGDGSAKLETLCEILEEARDGGHRVLVFSQFTSMLDLVGAALDERGMGWLRLDGGTRDRRAVVEEFQREGSAGIFLISLKAGGAGLNLTAADTVIHFDPWWNPAVEDQATDRAHRIGQRRVVTSIKLVCRDTVEERVVRLQEKKRETFRAAVDEESVINSLTVEEIAELVG